VKTGEDLLTILRRTLKLTCGHSEAASLFNYPRLEITRDYLNYADVMSRVSLDKNASWEKGLSVMFRSNQTFASTTRFYCSTCTTSENKSLSQKKEITKSSDSIVLTLDRCHNELHSGNNVQNIPIVIPPILNMIPYCEPRVLEAFIVKARPTYMASLTTSFSDSFPYVMIEMIFEYSVTPAQYSLESVVVQHDDTSKSVIMKKRNRNPMISVDEWWYISGISNIDPIHVKSAYIFTNDPTTTIVSLSDCCPLPLTHAVALRYQLI
jgi:hypothetical protein